MSKDDFAQRVLGSLPKNRAYETFVLAKLINLKGQTGKGAFIDFREMWFRDGPTEKPIFTRKGTMIRRDLMGKLINIIMRDLKPGEIDDEDLTEISGHVRRMGNVDKKAVVLKMLRSMGQDEVNDVISEL